VYNADNREKKRKECFKIIPKDTTIVFAGKSVSSFPPLLVSPGHIILAPLQQRNQSISLLNDPIE
jgi:hypothetical protein